MCCFKRATFCIIQRKVKRRYNLLVQIFIFLLRCLLNLVKVHIMLCTFKNGTIKSLILTLNMFKRFFFSFLFDMVSRTVMQKFCKVWRPKRAKILHALTSSAAEILHGMASNDAEILQGLTSSAAEILHALTSSAAEILHALTSTAAEILQAMTSWVKEILCVARSMLQKFWVVAFPFSKKTNCRGAHAYQQFRSVFFLMLFLFFSDHSWNNNTVHADVFWMTG